MAIDVTGIVGSVVGIVAGLFKSKKHYHLYYWEESACQWIFVMDGIPEQLRQAEAQLKSQGVKYYIRVRNKDAKYAAGELAPKEAPSGVKCEIKTGASRVNWLLVGAIVAGFGLIYLLLIRKRKK